MYNMHTARTIFVLDKSHGLDISLPGNFMRLFTELDAKSSGFE